MNEFVKCSTTKLVSGWVVELAWLVHPPLFYFFSSGFKILRAIECHLI